MNTPHHLLFLEEVTRRLAAAFNDVHQLCLQEIEKSQQVQAQQIEQEAMEEAEEVDQLPVDQAQQQSAEQPEKEQKQQKTKRIRKEGQDRASDEKGKKKAKAVSHKPKAPASSFLHFFKQQQASISKLYPNYGVTQLTKVAAKCWKDLSNEEKEPFIKQCEQQRKLYHQKMEQYRIEFPEQVAEKQKARKPSKKQKKTSANVGTPRKEKGQGQEKNGQAQNPSIMVVGQEASESDNQEQIDSLGV